MLRLRKFSFGFAEQVLNSTLAFKEEIDAILTDQITDLSSLSRFFHYGWQRQPAVFNEPSDPSAKIDFLKDRTGIEV